jgi:Spy/CpxP family protein refolding chaperone
MDKKVLVILLVISVAINLATMFTLGYFWWTRRGVEQAFGPDPRIMHEWQHSRIARELELSGAQIEEIRKANEEMRNAVHPLREELFEKRHELMSVLQAREANMAVAEALLDEISELQTQHEKQIFERLLMMKEILTPEQQEKLGSLLRALIEEGRPPGMPHQPPLPHRHFEKPRGEKGR